MKCWIFHTIAFFSLVLCITLVSQWRRSYFFDDAVLGNWHGQKVFLWTSRGLIRFERQWSMKEPLGGHPTDWIFETGPVRSFMHLSVMYHNTKIPWYQQRPGWFYYSKLESWPDFYVQELSIPIWSTVLVTAILPLIYLLYIPRWIRRVRRKRHSLCLKCGYDLRATPERCPECGKEVEKPAIPGI
jgi:hypothetical protein